MEGLKQVLTEERAPRHVGDSKALEPQRRIPQAGVVDTRREAPLAQLAHAGQRVVEEHRQRWDRSLSHSHVTHGGKRPRGLVGRTPLPSADERFDRQIYVVMVAAEDLVVAMTLEQYPDTVTLNGTVDLQVGD